MVCGFISLLPPRFLSKAHLRGMPFLFVFTRLFFGNDPDFLGRMRLPRFPHLQYQLATIFIPPHLLSKISSSIWSGLCKLVNIPHNTPHKARHKTIQEGGVGLQHTASRFAIQFIKHIGRYQLGQGPQQVNQLVQRQLQLAPQPTNPFSLTQHMLWAAQILGLHTQRITGQYRILDFMPPQQETPPVPYGQLLSPIRSQVHIQALIRLNLLEQDLLKHECHEGVQAIQQYPHSHHIYTDGSCIPQQRAGFSFITQHSIHRDRVLVQAGRSPYPCSYLSELLGILYALQYALTLPGSIIIFSDNMSLVNQIEQLGPSSLTFHLSYAWYFTLLLPIYLQLKHRLRIVWIKAHVGFLGNEYADRYASWASYLPLPSVPVTPPATLLYNNLPLVGKVPYKIYHERIPKRAHTHIHLHTSYLSWAKCGPFKDLPYKWTNGLISATGYQPYWSLRLVKCDLCVQEHAGDALSYLAHCSHFMSTRQRLHETFQEEWVPIVREWYDQATPHNRRLYIRGLTPNDLYENMSEQPRLRGFTDSFIRSSLYDIFKERVPLLLTWYTSAMVKIRDVVPSFTATNKRGPDEWAPTVVPPTQIQWKQYRPQPAPSGIIQEPKRRRPP